MSPPAEDDQGIRMLSLIKYPESVKRHYCNTRGAFDTILTGQVTVGLAWGTEEKGLIPHSCLLCVFRNWN